jgi:hypothetical protein
MPATLGLVLGASVTCQLARIITTCHRGRQAAPVTTARHDLDLRPPHIGEVTIDTSPMDNEASGVLAADHPVDLIVRRRLERARARLGQASGGVGPLAWIGVRSVVLIIVSMLVILVGLPAALVAARN